MVIALILAGGLGKRVGTEVPKQFLKINDVPVIAYTLKKFQECNKVDRICVVSHHDWIETVKKVIDKFNFNKVTWLVSGGQTGLESVQNGIISLSAQDDDDIIMIHDSVRPFITQTEIETNLEVAKTRDVAVTAVPCVETLVKVDGNGKSTEQIPRDSLMRVMTPQSFRLGILRSLFKANEILDSQYPSTFALYMSMGFPVYCSRGSERNIKITYPEDVEYLRHLFE